ncbi:MAG: twin-arginine translocation signal domain-containing protein, partial [Planctomycetes bacterium]|nr:twin-arginine translocation signal domain-containing protein [Planctomycetota bacterium]
MGRVKPRRSTMSRRAEVSRRDFMRSGAAAGAGLVVLGATARGQTA